MLKRIFLCGLFLVFGSISLFAQTDSKQWEYLTFYESQNKDFNDLGQKGWELVGIVPQPISDGNSNGSIKYIFKRPYDLLRIQQEAKLQYDKAQQPKIEIINLDEFEKQSSQTENEDKAKAKIEAAIRSVKTFFIVSVTPNAWFPNENDHRISAEVVIDGSKELLKDGNKYRSSEVDKFIHQAASEIYKAANLTPQYPGQESFATYSNSNRVKIKLSVIVNYKGAIKTLSEGFIQGDNDDTRKP